MLGRNCLLLLLLPLLLSCSKPAGLTIHNGLEHSVQISGLPGGPLDLAAGAQHRVRPVKKAFTLQATGNSFREEVSLALPPPQGEALWSVGGKACFVEADYSSYYSLPASMPAAISVLEVLSTGQSTHVSEGRIDAAPGERLPKSMHGGQVRAFIQIPCQVAASPEVARGWLEMTLDEIQPETASKKSTSN
ncbi:MAG: hypothetical protein VX498_11340 [Myxococcota bacterium]|nr:hypothetical protein [Myxococcota bacterium]